MDLDITSIYNKPYLCNKTQIAFAAEYVPYRWGKSDLKINFLNGEKKIKEKIKQAAKKWELKTGVNFIFGNHINPDITINIDKSQDSWSYIGKQSLSKSPSMNFGWLTAKTPQKEYDRVVLHEFGHALGLIHEHQHPDANIDWDSTAVLKFYEGKWSRKKVIKNIFKKYSFGETNSTNFDEKSIMIYAFPKSWTKNGYSLEWNTELSQNDIDLIKEVYKQ